MSASSKRRVLRLLASVLTVVLVTAVTYQLRAKSFSAGFIYLFPVMFIAFRWGLLEASFASLLSIGCLDYFFTNPLFHLYMSDPQDWIALSCFEAIALMVSRLADRLKQRAIEANHRSEQIEKLYLITRSFLMADQRHSVGSQIAQDIRDVFHLDEVTFWDARESRLVASGAGSFLGDEVQAAYLHECDSNHREGGKILRQMIVGSKSIGVIGFASGSEEAFLDAPTADAIASLAALALERAYYSKAESNAEASRQAEEFRSAVLDGLAHAFKTPLATIQAASSGLLETAFLQPAQEELAFLINQETLRLGVLTNEALQTADLNEEHLKLNKQQIDIGQFLNSVSEQSKDRLLGHPLSMVCEASAGVAWADERLLRMAILELVDNAAKYSDTGAQITLTVSMSDSEIIFSVFNAGSYIEPEERTRIFGRFYRASNSRHRASGTGIGLSFARRITESHNGRIWVKSDRRTGTTVFISLPRAPKEI